MRNITEGMRAGDLADLVLPLISVDEYESKIDDDAIAIGFYVHDRDAANDLNRFIQKSAATLLGTDVSPAPDQHGYYLVFVEFLNDARVSKNINAIIEEISSLVEITKWKMRVRGSDELVPFSKKVLDKHFSMLRNDDKDHDALEENIMNFLMQSSLTDAIIESNILKIYSQDGAMQGNIIGMGYSDEIFESHELINEAVSLGIKDIATSLYIQRILGEGWVPSTIGDKVLLQRSNCDLSLLISDIRFI